MKLVLLIKCKADPSFVTVFLKVARPITWLIMAGLVLLTLSGVVWLLTGYPVASLLVVKIILVVMIWLVGPIIDKVAEPKLQALVPAPGEQGSPAFLRALNLYLVLEIIADGFFYAIIILWVLR